MVYLSKDLKVGELRRYLILAVGIPLRCLGHILPSRILVEYFGTI